MLIGLTLATIGSFVAVPLFRTIPQAVFSGIGLATAFAAIAGQRAATTAQQRASMVLDDLDGNSIAQLSGLVSPVLVGWVNDITGTPHLGLLISASAGILAAALILRFVPKKT